MLAEKMKFTDEVMRGIVLRNLQHSSGWGVQTPLVLQLIEDRAWLPLADWVREQFIDLAEAEQYARALESLVRDGTI